MEEKSILKLTGKHKEKAIDLLMDNGKKEFIELDLPYQGKNYKAAIVVEFKDVRKAQKELIKTSLTGTKKNPNVDVSLDPIGAGDVLLFNCWHEGDEDIKRKMPIRIKACKFLGEWFQSYIDGLEDDKPEEEEKKS